MHAQTTRSVVLSVPLAILLVVAACSEPGPSASAKGPADGVQKTTAQTASYRMELWTGPAVTLMSAFPTMTTMDQGQPANRHIEVHIYDRNTGGKVTEVTPTVRITNQTTGTSRGLPDVAACMVSKHRDIEPHFGDNIYLPDGKYTVTIGVGSEGASFDISF